MSIIRGSNIATVAFGVPPGGPCGVTVTFPAGTLAGDLAVLFSGCSTTVVTAPAGWTPIFVGGSFAWTGWSGWKVLTSGDITAGSVTIMYAGAFGSCWDRSAGIVTFVGAQTIREDQGNNTTGNTLTMDGSVQPGDVAIYFGSTGNNSGITITPIVGSATVLQTGVTSGSSSKLSAQEPLPGGSLTVTYGASPGSFLFNVQVIIQGSGPRPITYTCAVGSGVTGTVYFGSISVSGGFPPYCVAIVNPTVNPFPPGLIWSVSTSAAITITGLPIKPGTYTFTFNITDSHGNFVCATCTITVTGTDLSCVCGTIASATLYVQACYSQPPAAEAGAIIQYGFPVQLGAYYGFISFAPPNLTVANQLTGTSNCNCEGLSCSTLTLSPSLTDCHGDICSVIKFSEVFACDLAACINDPINPFYHDINGMLASLSVAATNTGFIFYTAPLYPYNPTYCAACDLEIYDIFVAIEYSGGALYVSRPRTVDAEQGSGLPVCAAYGGGHGGAVPFSLGGALLVEGSCAEANTFCVSLNVSLLQWAKGALAYPARCVWSDFYLLNGAPNPCPTCTQSPTTLTVNCPPILDGMMGIPFNASILVTGGNAPYTLDITSGILPPGLSLVNATISGKPSSGGSFTFTVRVTDSSSPTAQVVSQTCTIKVIGVSPQKSPFGTGQFRSYRKMRSK